MNFLYKVTKSHASHLFIRKAGHLSQARAFLCPPSRTIVFGQGATNGAPCLEANQHTALQIQTPVRVGPKGPPMS